jgi:hypothetical protein
LKTLTRCKSSCRASRHWQRRDWGAQIDAPNCHVRVTAFPDGISRRLFGQNVRSIRFSALVAASCLLLARPDLFSSARTDTVHLHVPRSMPWTMLYSTPRYSIPLLIPVTLGLSIARAFAQSLGAMRTFVIAAHTFVTFRTNDLRKAIPMVHAPRQAINVSRYDLTGETQCS